MAGSLWSSGYAEQQQSHQDGDFFGGLFGARDEPRYTDRSYPSYTSEHGFAVGVHQGSAFSSLSSHDSCTASAFPHAVHPPHSQLEFAYGAAGAPALANAARHGYAHGHAAQRYDGYGNSAIGATHRPQTQGSQPFGADCVSQHGLPGGHFPGGRFPGGHFPGGPAAPGFPGGGPAYHGTPPPWGASPADAGADCCGPLGGGRPGGDRRRHRTTGCC